MSIGLTMGLILSLFGSNPTALLKWAKAPTDRVTLARALAEADLPHLSSGALAEALILDRQTPSQISKALEMYPLSLRGYPPVVLSIGALSTTEGLDSIHGSLQDFVVGQSLLAAGRPNAALVALGRVAPGSAAYAPAQYLSGVAHMTPPNLDFSTAGRAFRSAIVEAETSPQKARVVVQEARNMALLGLARLFYETGNLEVALYYYHRLPVNAPGRAQAAFESAWAHVLRGDMHRALGAIHGARSPGVVHPARPELHLVAGAALLGMCQYARGRAELDRLETEYLAQLSRLSTAGDMLRRGDDDEYARRLISSESPLPPRIRFMLANQPGVKRGQRIEAAIDGERQRIASLALDQGLSFDAVSALGEHLAKAQRARTDTAIRSAVSLMVEDWTRLRDSRSELMIDLLEAEGSAIEEEIRTGRLEDEAPPEARIPGMSQDWQRWNFGGEWWPDELGFYRSTLPSLCRNTKEDDR